MKTNDYTFQEKCQLLSRLNKQIEEYFRINPSYQVARSTDIYDHVKKIKELSKITETPIIFSRFLRQTYKEKLLTQIIKNCRVTIDLSYHYEWRFYHPAKQPVKEPLTEDKKRATFHPETTRMMPWDKKYEASNGIKVRSQQELYILEQLLAEEDFDIYYERKLSFQGETWYPDFTVTVKSTLTVYHWEHFGMNDVSKYNEKMIEKLATYKRAGYTELHNGGRLIITTYQNQSQFESQVAEIIRLLKSTSN